MGVQHFWAESFWVGAHIKDIKWETLFQSQSGFYSITIQHFQCMSFTNYQQNVKKLRVTLYSDYEFPHVLGKYHIHHCYIVYE